MHFTIITPSFNQLDYLKRCVSSVADQAAPVAQRSEDRGQRTDAPITVHHHIQDGGSTDGTVAFLEEMATEDRDRKTEVENPAYTFSYESAVDNGMYDALNRGIELVLGGQRAENGRLKTGGGGLETDGRGQSSFSNNQQPITISSRDSVIAWLNCDEQYLPGTLQKVADFFASNPDVDLLCGGMLMVDEQGQLLACRKAMPMRKLFLEASYLYNYSCAMFFRQSLWEKLGGFDTSFKNAGDEDLIRRALELKAKCCVLNDYLSTFTYSDTNLSSDPMALEEHQRLKESASFFAKAFKLPINLLRLAEKVARRGHVQHDPVAYEIYAEHLTERSCFVTANPSCSWPSESKPYLMSHRLK